MDLDTLVSCDSEAARHLLGQGVWDTLIEFGCLSPSFVDAYDTIVSVLYRGDEHDENRPALHGVGMRPGVQKDARLVPLREWADERAARAARSLVNGGRPDLIRKNVERLAQKLKDDLHRLDMCRWCDPRNK